ncbi:MAG: hypothetical protein Q9210_004894 [Variospora velana]
MTTIYENLNAFTVGQAGLAYFGLMPGFLTRQIAIRAFTDRHIEQMKYKNAGGTMDPGHSLFCPLSWVASSSPPASYASIPTGRSNLPISLISPCIGPSRQSSHSQMQNLLDEPQLKIGVVKLFMESGV